MVERPASVRYIAAMVFPVALGGVVVSAVLNAITWLPIDVSGFTPAWLLVFAGVFPVWFAVIGSLSREQQMQRVNEKLPWYRSGRRFRWQDVVSGVPRWAVVLLMVIVVYVAINFFASIAQLPGQPEVAGGQYYFNNHGSRIPTDLAGYLQGLRLQMRIFTGHPMVFYGVAALAMYSRRGQHGSVQTGERP